MIHYFKFFLRFVRANFWLYYVAIGITVVLMITLVCCEGPRRKSPLNFFLLFIFTCCEGFMLGTISTFYSVDAILIAVGITSGVAFFLTIFAFQTKIDFTNCGGIFRYDVNIFTTKYLQEWCVHYWLFYAFLEFCWYFYQRQSKYTKYSDQILLL